MIDTVSETQEEMIDEVSEENTDQNTHMEEHAEKSEQNRQEQFDGVKEDVQWIGQDLVEGLQTLAADLQGFGKVPYMLPDMTLYSGARLCQTTHRP